ncbi:hypothetical protein D9611_012486 [Ephemerocybe angulata]|uniref:Uncharacterized protein n=1 Tax=Ephemerocybe angulata TaxID=980116 RepID=A0A8H5CC37_9AGAR|nr:hypothetical protein D9611_012486 [Tulosesus angulatus]
MPMIQPMSLDARENVDAEDIMFDALQTIFDLKPISVGSLASSFVYSYHGIEGSEQYTPRTITLDTPDTKAANWHLHASAVWVSSIYLADHISELGIPVQTPQSPDTPSPLRVLELGASAGLPSILLAKLHPDLSITVSDYPDEALISTLSRNVESNKAGQNCRVVPYAWGADPTPLIGDAGDGFDLILAADTLWNSDLHQIFIDSLTTTLKRAPSSRIHLIAGLHTGRYTIQAVLARAQASDLEIDTIIEREVDGNRERPWCADRFDDGDQERRQWVVWVKLRWASVKATPSAQS